MIHIINNYYFSADAHSIQIVEKRTTQFEDKKNKDYFVNLTYHTGLQSAFDGITEIMVREGLSNPNSSLKELIQSFERLKEAIKDVNDLPLALLIKSLKE